MLGQGRTTRTEVAAARWQAHQIRSTGMYLLWIPFSRLAQFLASRRMTLHHTLGCQYCDLDNHLYQYYYRSIVLYQIARVTAK